MAAVLVARLRLWLPVVIWAGVIFGFSSIPSLSTGLGTWDLVLRKLAHAAEFAVLAILIYRAIPRFATALALASAYAATDEVHQLFVEGRAGSPVDWLVDTAGAAAGLVLYLAWRRRR
jgi:VanZ family protein